MPPGRRDQSPQSALPPRSSPARKFRRYKLVFRGPAKGARSARGYRPPLDHRRSLPPPIPLRRQDKSLPRLAARQQSPPQSESPPPPAHSFAGQRRLRTAPVASCIETHETVRRSHQVAHHGQAGIGGEVIDG